jgi:hypothetical protein
MPTLRELKRLMEAKQVGTIYHYTTVKNLHDMINSDHPFVVGSHNKQTISTTRNPNLHKANPTFNTRGVRIALDGDKISQNHKVKPVAGLTDNEGDVLNHKHNDKFRVKRSSGEAEEAIMHHPFNMKPFIKHVHIIYHRDTADDVEKHIIPKLKHHGIPYSHKKSLDESDIFEYCKFEDENKCYEILIS